MSTTDPETHDGSDTVKADAKNTDNTKDARLDTTALNQLVHPEISAIQSLLSE